MSKFKDKLAARGLRRQGWSISSIAKQLDVSKGSVSIWCRDLELTLEQKEILIRNAIAAGHRGRLLGTETNKRKKQELIDFYKDSGKKEVGALTKKALFYSGIGLYWGEGSKSGKLSFTNSDPEAIKFMALWFKEVMGVRKEELMPRIYINETHKPRIRKVISFWSKILGLPVAQFGNPTFIKSKQKKVYENYDNYYGIISLRIRNSTRLKYRVLGIIDALKALALMPG